MKRPHLTRNHTLIFFRIRFKFRGFMKKKGESTLSETALIQIYERVRLQLFFAFNSLILSLSLIVHNIHLL
jgi:hypothetical protein